MRILVYIIITLLSGVCLAQKPVSATLVTSQHLTADRFIRVNTFNDIFFVLENTLHKKSNQNDYVYNNIALGNLNSIDVLNPLEITLFYKDYNTVIQLDNRLNEINKLDFNLASDFKNIGYAATATNKRLWTYNTDNQQLEIYNFQLDLVEATTLPLPENIITFYSNYNFCWALTSSGLYQYNVYGNLLNTYALEGFENFVYNKGNLILLKEEKLYLLNVEDNTPRIINLPELSIKDFSLTNETLYIYDGKTLSTFSLNLKNE